jgi:tetraacyldisaccharide 4'-kinase
VGGAGKTTLALDLIERLANRGLRPHALTRGHGRVGKRLVRAGPPHAAVDVKWTGDEAQLLASVVPCWICADRAQAARAAEREGADVLVMDDGLQNFGLEKDCSLLVVDGDAGFGNGLVLPAGPMREKPERALARCRAMVLIGEDQNGIVSRYRGRRPILRASLKQGPEVEQLRGRNVVAFAGIGRPAKFFDSLANSGISPIRRVSFPDHHRYDATDLARLSAIRDRLGADAIFATTPKDAVRLPSAFRSQIVTVSVRLEWADDRIDQLIDAVLSEVGTL